MTKETKIRPLCIDIREAKPNKLFTEEQRRWLRFLVYNKKIKCARCNRKVKVMWTMLCEFYAMEMGIHSMSQGEKLGPLTPVCEEHPLKPALD